MIYLKPVLPQISHEAEAFLDCSALTWADLERPLLNHVIKPYQALLNRVDPTHIEAMVQASKDSTPAAVTPVATALVRHHLHRSSVLKTSKN